MTGFDERWVDDLVEKAAGCDPIGGLPESLVVQYVVETDDGKQLFHLSFSEGRLVEGQAGKLPRGEKADITITAKDSVIEPLWSGTRSRDVVYMSADLKVEGAYAIWLDRLVPAFESKPWDEVWKKAI